ncbi:MAG: hypothetical protein CL955_02315 [Erythrobacteraceae bacterium]|nr:hypothetical protein [Erythrobacteraceae bacterium]|tara:strand:+ start:674 stop:889 length:216 start_codon:yes stop_codon:yes gene_type:complete
MTIAYAQFDPAAQNRVPFNVGERIGPKRPFNEKQDGAIRFVLDREKRVHLRLCDAHLLELFFFEGGMATAR